MKRVQEPPPITHPFLVEWRNEAVKWARRRPGQAHVLAKVLEDTFPEEREEHLRSEVNALVRWLTTLNEEATSPADLESREGTRTPGK